MLIKKQIEYLGIESPSTPGQVRVEMAGLRQAIKVAEELVCRLEQALAIAELKQEEYADAKLQKAVPGGDSNTEGSIK